MDFWKHVTESRLCFNRFHVYSPMHDITVPKRLRNYLEYRQACEHAQIL
jgi:hypothetical protein